MEGCGGVVVALVEALALLLCCSVQLGTGLLDCSGEACTDTVCTAHVTVDLESPTHCGLLGETVINSTCNSLQDVLSGLALVSGYRQDDCIEIRLSPGIHRLTQNVTIEQSVVIAGSGGVAGSSTPPPPYPAQDETTPTAAEYDSQIRFSISEELLPSNGSDPPFYVLSFVGGALLSMTTLQMTGSPGIIEIVNVSNVWITNCSFSYFQQGALDIFNCQSVSLTNCDFFHNGPVQVTKIQEYKGHSGGLSIGYSYMTEVEASLQASIEECVFHNNSAHTDDSAITSQVLIDRVFPGRGGGLSLLVNSITVVTINVTNCDFLKNYATAFGGGAYTVLDGLSNHVITFQSCDFVDNQSGNQAGGLEIEFDQNGNETFSNRVVCRDCLFLGNEALYGGAVYLFHIVGSEGVNEGGNTAIFERCQFEGNHATEVGAAFGAVSDRFFDNKEDFRPLVVVDCTFTGNEVVRGATVSVAFFPITFRGINTFQNGRGPSLVVMGSVLRVEGVLQLRKNDLSGLGGGTLYLLSHGQVVLTQHSRLVFESNRGVMGSATVVETLHSPKVFSSLLYNKLCFLRYQDPTLSPLQWHQHNVSMEYNRNWAIVGAAIFTDSLRQCSWTSLSPPHFNLTGAFHWPFITLSDNNNRAHAPNGTDPKWAVQTSAFDVNIINNSVSAFAGEDTTLGIEAKDELGEATPIIFRLSQNTMGEVTYKFSPSTINYDRLIDGQIRTSFFQNSTAPESTNHSITLETLLDESLRDEFSVTSDPCPAGTALIPHPTITGFSVCICDIDHPSILDCDGRKIILEDGLWGFVDMGKKKSQDPLETYPCPLGYCGCEFRLEGNTMKCRYRVDDRNLDDQCVCEREGVLCGSCREGKGVSVLRKTCTTCHNGFAAFIVALIIGDVVVMVLMLLLMIPVPAALLPGIFYVQLLPYLTEHFPVTFEKLHPFMLYVSSAISLYFPYDLCLYDDMTALVSHSLHYLPLVTALLITPAVLFIRRITRHPAPMHGVSWIIILLYTPVLHTSMTALHCPQIKSRDSAISYVWYPSGDQTCFTGGHIPLAIVAILTLIFLLAAIPTVILFSLNKIKSARFSSHLLVAPFSHMYRSECVWWWGVELGRRVVMVLFITSFPGNTYPAYFVLVVVVTVQAYVQPYRRTLWNVLELVMSANVLILLLLRNTDYIEEILQTYPDQPSQSGGRSGGGGGGNNMKCSDEIDGVTPFATLLAVFYYIPLLMFTTTAVLWLALLVWSAPSVRRLRDCLFSGSAASVEESSLNLYQMSPHHRHTPTSTTVDLEELSKIPPEESLELSSSTRRGGREERLTDTSIGSSIVLKWVNSFRRRLGSHPTLPTVTTSPPLPPLLSDTPTSTHTPNTPSLSITNPTASLSPRDTPVKITYIVVNINRNDDNTPSNPAD